MTSNRNWNNNFKDLKKIFRGVHNFWSEKCGVHNINSHKISFHVMWLGFWTNQNPPNCTKPGENVRFQAFFFPFKEQSCFTALLKIKSHILHEWINEKRKKKLVLTSFSWRNWLKWFLFLLMSHDDGNPNPKPP